MPIPTSEGRAVPRFILGAKIGVLFAGKMDLDLDAAARGNKECGVKEYPSDCGTKLVPSNSSVGKLLASTRDDMLASRVYNILH